MSRRYNRGIDTRRSNSTQRRMRWSDLLDEGWSVGMWVWAFLCSISGASPLDPKPSNSVALVRADVEVELCWEIREDISICIKIMSMYPVRSSSNVWFLVKQKSHIPLVGAEATGWSQSMKRDEKEYNNQQYKSTLAASNSTRYLLSTGNILNVALVIHYETNWHWWRW